MLKKLSAVLAFIPLLLSAATFTIDPAKAAIRIADAKLMQEAKELRLNLFKLTGKNLPIIEKTPLQPGYFCFENRSAAEANLFTLACIP